ncbi:MAG: hypothetical protein OXR84_11295 [Magnetovibrio sp.]|nr:hypothetical protein [Magnetovibrio sp.]
MPLNIAIEVDSLAAHFALVDEAGLYSILGTSALTSGSARGEFASSLIVRPQLSRPTVLKTTRQRPLSLAAREVIKHIRAIAKSWSALAA